MTPWGRRVTDQSPSGASVDSWLRSLDADELRELVLTLADIQDALCTGGFVSYRRSYEVAQDADRALRDVEDHLDLGTTEAAEAVRPALDYAVKRLRKILLDADDSGGSIGESGQWAVDLHARACRQGHPDAAKLARWLVKFRRDSPGWPDVTLDMYAAAFDTKALTTYRRGVDKYVADLEGQPEHYAFEARRMLLELADHDGDLDRAVTLLSQREHPAYAAIIERLRAAGRDAEAMTWLDMAVVAGKVRPEPLGDVWLGADDVARAYVDHDRGADALEFLRGEFDRRADTTAYQRLVSYAVELGLEQQERSWANQRAQEWATRHGRGDLPILIALAESDLDRAWDAADRWGAGNVWRELAEAGAALRPRQAADLYRPWLEGQLSTADTSRYRPIAQVLVRMRALYATAGVVDEFDDEVRALREEDRRRPSLIKELDRAGLPT